MPSNTWNLCIGDVLDRIAGAGVLRQRSVAVIDFSSCRVMDRILKNRSKTNRLVNLWFRFRGQVNRLGITATFDIENAVVGPAVFIISD